MKDTNDGPASEGTHVVTIELSNDLTMIAYTRMVLRQVLPALDEDTSSMYYGAVTEILTNAIEAHESAATSDVVIVEANLDPPCTISVHDKGAGFDPSLRLPRAGVESGMGLAIARSVIPGLTIDSSSSGTSIHLPYPTT